MKLAYPHHSLLLVGGVPGSGKSYLLRQTEILGRPYTTKLSADDLRGEIQAKHGEEANAFNPERIPEARDLFFERLHDAFRDRNSIICEAAYLSARSRDEMIHWAEVRDYPVHLLVVRATLAECEAGVSSRDRSVPSNVLRGYFKQWTTLNAELARGKLQRGLSSAVVIRRTDTLESIAFPTP